MLTPEGNPSSAFYPSLISDTHKANSEQISRWCGRAMINPFPCPHSSHRLGNRIAQRSITSLIPKLTGHSCQMQTWERRKSYHEGSRPVSWWGLVRCPYWPLWRGLSRPLFPDVPHQNLWTFFLCSGEILHTLHTQGNKTMWSVTW